MRRSTPAAADPGAALDTLPADVQSAVMALGVMMDRVNRLPKPDRDDLFDLLAAWRKAEGEEELLSVRRALREILAQAPVKVIDLPPAKRSGPLKKWSRHVGIRIKQARGKAGLTQAQLAVAADLPQSYLSRLENAEHAPTHKTIAKIAAALKVDPGSLDPYLD